MQLHYPPAEGQHCDGSCTYSHGICKMEHLCEGLVIRGFRKDCSKRVSEQDISRVFRYGLCTPFGTCIKSTVAFLPSAFSQLSSFSLLCN